MTKIGKSGTYMTCGIRINLLYRQAGNGDGIDGSGLSNDLVVVNRVRGFGGGDDAVAERHGKAQTCGYQDAGAVATASAVKHVVPP